MTIYSQVQRADRMERRAEGGEDARLIDVFARRETERERRARIARKQVNPKTAEALRRLWAA